MDAILPSIRSFSIDLNLARLVLLLQPRIRTHLRRHRCPMEYSRSPDLPRRQFWCRQNVTGQICQSIATSVWRKKQRAYLFKSYKSVVDVGFVIETVS